MIDKFDVCVLWRMQQVCAARQCIEVQWVSDMTWPAAPRRNILYCVDICCLGINLPDEKLFIVGTISI